MPYNNGIAHSIVEKKDYIKGQTNKIEKSEMESISLFSVFETNYVPASYSLLLFIR